MSRTDTDVVVTQYRAQFRATPFCRPRWTITSGMQSRETLPRRRRWTVVEEFLDHGGAHREPARKVPDTGIGHIHESMLIDPEAVVVFVPDTRPSRYGIAVVIEQKLRHDAPLTLYLQRTSMETCPK